MDIDSLTIGEVKQIAGIFQASQASPAVPATLAGAMIGKMCVLRTCSAGVHYGEVAEHIGMQVVLKKARRIWKWEGAFTLNEVSKGKFSGDTRMSDSVDQILLTEVIEIIPVTEAGVSTLSGSNTYIP